MDMTDDLDDGWERAEAAELTQSVIDDLTSANAALRARVAELERDLRSETARRERNESALAGERDEAEQRVAELQAEVERLTADRDTWAEEARVREERAIRAEQALTEAERKRAELLDKHRALHAVVRYHGT